MEREKDRARRKETEEESGTASVAIMRTNSCWTAMWNGLVGSSDCVTARNLVSNMINIGPGELSGPARSVLSVSWFFLPSGSHSRCRIPLGGHSDTGPMLTISSTPLRSLILESLQSRDPIGNVEFFLFDREALMRVDSARNDAGAYLDKSVSKRTS